MAKLEELLVRGATEAPRPLYCGAVGVIHFQGHVEQFATVGHSATYVKTSGKRSSSGSFRPGVEETIFDLSSAAGELARLRLARRGGVPRCYGALDGVPIPSEETADEMTRDQLPAGLDRGGPR